MPSRHAFVVPSSSTRVSIRNSAAAYTPLLSNQPTRFCRKHGKWTQIKTNQQSRCSNNLAKALNAMPYVMEMTRTIEARTEQTEQSFCEVCFRQKHALTQLGKPEQDQPNTTEFEWRC